MKDVALPLRRAYYQALKDQVTINGAIVPVVDAKMEVEKTEQDIVIYVSNQNDQERNTKCSFITNSEISLDIVHRMKSAGTKRIVDLICDQILTTLFPDKRSHNLSMETGFQLQSPRLKMTNTTAILPIESGFMQVKTVVFSNIIIQN